MSEHKEEFTTEDIMTALYKLAVIGAVRELGVDLPTYEKLSLRGLLTLAKFGADSDNERDFVRTCQRSLDPRDVECFLGEEQLSTEKGKVPREIKRGECTVIKRGDDDKVIEEIYDDYDYNKYIFMVGDLSKFASSTDNKVKYCDNCTGIIVSDNSGHVFLETGWEETTITNIRECIDMIEYREEEE